MSDFTGPHTTATLEEAARLERLCQPGPGGYAVADRVAGDLIADAVIHGRERDAWLWVMVWDCLRREQRWQTAEIIAEHAGGAS